MKELSKKIKQELLDLNKISMNKIDKTIKQKKLKIDCPDKKEINNYCARAGLGFNVVLGVFFINFWVCLIMNMYGMSNNIILSVLIILLPLSFYGYSSLMKKIVKLIYIHDKKTELNQLLKEKSKTDKNIDLINDNNVPEEYENEIISKEILAELREYIENKEILDMIFSKNGKIEINYKQANMLLNLKKSNFSKEILENCAIKY